MVGFVCCDNCFLTDRGAYIVDMKTAISNQSTWNNCDTNLLNSAIYVILNAYVATHKIFISYTILGNLFGMTVLPLSYIMN
jgi:hypothetical protein